LAKRDDAGDEDAEELAERGRRREAGDNGTRPETSVRVDAPCTSVVVVDARK
jgi:hypothetical protein